MIVLARPFPLEERAASDLALQWVSVSTFAQAAASVDLLNDERARDESMWLERREWILDQERQRRLAAGLILGSDAVRGAFDSDSLRLVAHVLRRVGPETPPQERLLQQRTAERILASLVGGGGWDAAVAQSEDPATRDSAGLLGLFGPGELQPAALDRAAFRLAPGEASAVVQSPRGFHIVYRPRFEDASGLFSQRLRQRRLMAADALANRALLSERAVDTVPGGADLIRRIVDDPPAWMAREEPIVAWSGGSLPASVAARYAAALPDAGRESLVSAGSEEWVRFGTDLAVREIRVGDYMASVDALPEALDSLVHQGHRAEVEYWFAALSEDGIAPPSRDGVASYMNALVSRRQDTSVVSPVLEAWLLSQAEHTVASSGVEAAVAGARSMIQGARSVP